MKISYRTHPALKVITDKLEQNKNVPAGQFPILDTFRSAINNVQVLSSAFEKAIDLSFDSLQKDDLYVEMTGSQGVLISGRFTYVYKIVDIRNMYMIKFIGETPFATLFLVSGVVANAYIHPEYKSPVSQHKALRYIFTEMMTALIFIKYAKVETKILEPNSRVKGIDCKYINETNTNIKHLDITWFTTLIKSDGFDVRGHWRLQPKKKDGEWTKEIIWINPFKKHGYTRHAGITKQDTFFERLNSGEAVIPLEKLHERLS